MGKKGGVVKNAIVIAVALGLAFPSGAWAQGMPADGVRPQSRRDAIRMMEAVLSRAVLTGAERLAEQLGSGNPGMSFFTGQARARGFILDGYGVFFHVEIPEMQQSLVVSVATVARDLEVAAALDSLRQATDAVPQGPQRMQAEQAFRRIQLLVGPVAPLPAAAARAAPPGLLRSADTAPVNEPAESVSAVIMRDPTTAYRQAIQGALIDAMLEHSRGITLGPDEWLSVAAHRGSSALMPNEIVTSSTLVLRIKGRDLALYDADRSRKDEIRARVEVREF
jgi:hypothetical protein